MKRQRRRQRKHYRLARNKLVDLVIDLLAKKNKKDIKNSILWSMNTWGGNCCQDCGITVPSPAVLDRGSIYYENGTRLIYYCSNCKYLSNCKAGNNWSGLELTGVGIPKQDWKLLLFRDLDKKFIKELLDGHRGSKEVS